MRPCHLWPNSVPLLPNRCPCVLLKMQRPLNSLKIPKTKSLQWIPVMNQSLGSSVWPASRWQSQNINYVPDAVLFSGLYLSYISWSYKMGPLWLAHDFTREEFWGSDGLDKLPKVWWLVSKLGLRPRPLTPQPVLSYKDRTTANFEYSLHLPWC